MIEEPYRWLEAIENRREYVLDQLRGISPAFAIRDQQGILLVGAGVGRSRIFEIFDRQAMAGLGHPADIEKIRQAMIDAAHVEAFTRSPEDVTLSRLVSFGLGPQLKNSFEQIYGAPILSESLFVEVGIVPEQDSLIRVHFDGAYDVISGDVAVLGASEESEDAMADWLAEHLAPDAELSEKIDLAMQTWWMVLEGKSFVAPYPEPEIRKAGWRQRLLNSGMVLEIGWLQRSDEPGACYESISFQLNEPQPESE